MKKRITAVLILAVFVLSLFAGCSGRNDQGPDDNSVSQNTSEQAGGSEDQSKSAETDLKADTEKQSSADTQTQDTRSQDTQSEEQVEAEARFNGEFIDGMWTGDGISFVHDLRLGWNLGNTFDAHTDLSNRPSLDYETYWCGAKTKPELFKLLHDTGFNAVRIPVSWHNHVSGEDFTIDEKWFARVNEVVDAALDNGLYVIINTHHDIYKEYLYPSSECIEGSKHYIESIWSQVAERFKDYDEHLIFESMNEPRLKDTALEWTVSSSDEGKDSCESINILNQLFVDTVRASGGFNADRFLLVPGYAASPDGVMTSNFRIPEDTAEDRIILSVHAYTPYSFALQSPSESGSTSTFNKNAWGGGKDIEQFMKQIYYKYVYKGIPVVIGEFGARGKDNLDDRVAFAGFYVSTAKNYDLTCFWWDNNVFSGSGERFGIIDRSKLSIRYQGITDALVAASKLKVRSLI